MVAVFNRYYTFSIQKLQGQILTSWKLIENPTPTNRKLGFISFRKYISGPKAPCNGKKLCELLATIVTEEGGRYAIASK